MTADEYALEKLMQAVDALATGSGRVQERLANAAIPHHRPLPVQTAGATLTSERSLTWPFGLDASISRLKHPYTMDGSRFSRRFPRHRKTRRGSLLA
jgi:hypothetical protein